MFVEREFPGARAGTSPRLLDTLIDHAHSRAMRDVFLEPPRSRRRLYRRVEAV